MLRVERRKFASHHFRHVGMAGILLLASLFPGCRKPASPVTITYFDSDGRGVPGDHRMIPEAYLQEFTRETGIRVNDLPTPEDNGSKLDLAMDLLRSGAPSPDLYGVDTIWTGIMGDYLIDLQPYFASEISSEDRDIVESYMDRGKVVGMPNQPLGVQVLIYRTDLLTRYATKRHPERGMSLRKWPPGFRLESAQKEKRIFGDSFGPERSQPTANNLRWKDWNGKRRKEAVTSSSPTERSA